MKLAEKHKQFAVKCFAQFMKLRDIVEAFVEEFEDESRELVDKSYFGYDEKQELAALFRRLNITHSQFPEKYRALFNEERERFLAAYRDTTLHIPDNIIRELEALYGLTRELVFEEREDKYINLALQILKTIAACNAANAQEKVVEITPEEVKQLTTTTKTLTGEVKKESRRLTNMAN